MANAAIEDLTADGSRVLLVGHSAGGWLARAVVGLMGVEKAGQRIAGVVSLGSPHVPPPEGVLDVTRGVVSDLQRRFSAKAMLQTFGVPVCCVVSGEVNRDTPPAEEEDVR